MCEHKYIFLRQEEVPMAWNGDRVMARKIEDVYFCEKCLEYKRVRIREEVPSRYSFNWVTVL